jgi:hypothetical protein
LLSGGRKAKEGEIKMEPVKRELLLCVPGPWKDRSEFVQAVVGQTKGEFMFAGMILANPGKKDHVPLDFTPVDLQMRKAFEIAGQGRLSPQILDRIAEHRGVAYLHFPVGIVNVKDRVVTFTDALRCCGGFAVKVESAGVAHEWAQWFAALSSENPFDLYRTFVTLIGDTNYYYSCGMHHFGLADVEIDRSVEIKEAADVMNRFNYWQIVEAPKLASGHTFSISPDAPRYRISQERDSRHEPSDFFHNPSGMWRLQKAK